MNLVNEQAPSGNAGRSKSAAMLGLALSVGASGVLFADSEATAAVGSFVIANSATSNEAPQLPSVLQNQLERPSTSSQTVYHTVQQGDSLWQIAQEHQVEIQDIKIANRISPGATLQVGQVIKVPNEEQKSSLVSLLPSTQKDVSEQQAQAPNLERLVAGISNSDRNIAARLPQVEAKDVVDEPAIIATEELTGDVSLRSAGLVSQSDGFQADLEQLASTQANTADALSASNLSVNELSPAENAIDTASDGYEVIPGDTVEDIAISLGTTPDKLAEVNSLEDPDFIVAGETLSLPEEVTNNLIISEAASSIAQSSTEVAVSSSLNSFDGARLSRLQSTVENRINNAPSTLQRLRGGQGGSIVTQPDETTLESMDNAEAPAIEDPYTADLIADVNIARELAPVEADVAVSQELEIAANADTEIALNASVVAVPDSSSVVNPEFKSDQLEARAVSDTGSSTASSELLAAAPLDPSVYVSSPSPAVGQVVSPEMPILPSADEYLPEAPDYFNGYIWPTRGTLTSGYGWRWGRMHRGIDVAGPVGTPIVAAAPGVVEKAGWNSGGYGNMVEVRHADGSMTRYAHNSRITVRSGQRVAQGQHIADMGSTGYSTGPHLHFEVHLPNRGTINPMAMLPSR
ncbi:MAG: peptidoglycan DD-metalloendopeptidase family protein [Cyanobacteria bacterium P01_H01_bin.21]